MAKERDDQDLGATDDGSGGARKTMGERAQQNEFGQQQGHEANGRNSHPNAGGQSQSDQDGMAGQPIGGNDSSTGTGTTMSQGADFGNQSGGSQGQSDSGSGETLTHDQSSFGQHTTSNAGGSTVGSDQTSGGSSGVSGGQGFVGSQADTSSDYLQQDSSDGAIDNEECEPEA